jgi:adenylate kinase family enzyme
VDQAFPRRLRVVGNCGVGKTTFARRTARRLGVPHLELDAAFWGPDWVHADPVAGRATVEAFVAQPEARYGWVVDGSWDRRLGDTLRDVEAIIWLDFPRRVVMRRVVARALGRLVLRRELWHGNRERWRNLARRSPEENIVLRAWTQHEEYRRRYGDLAAAGGVRVVRLTSPRHARRWLEGRSPRPASDG